MNFYPWHIGDYKSHTDHLTPKEDICYRRILDYYYLHETPIPNDIPAVARHIKMRDSEETIKAILSEFFDLRGDKWHSIRADKEIEAYTQKSEKARKSIAFRWANTNVIRTNNERNTNVIRSGYECNTTNTNTNTNIVKEKTTRKAFKIPEAKDVSEYASSIGFSLEGEHFVDYYTTRGWKIGSAAMKDWKAAVRTWKRNSKDIIPTNTSFVKEV